MPASPARETPVIVMSSRHPMDGVLACQSGLGAISSIS